VIFFANPNNQTFQVSQSEAERESDKVMEDLINGKVTNIDEFLEKFMVKSEAKFNFQLVRSVVEH
jgi:hypothetical protein